VRPGPAQSTRPAGPRQAWRSPALSTPNRAVLACGGSPIAPGGTRHGTVRSGSLKSYDPVTNELVNSVIAKQILPETSKDGIFPGLPKN
jgi:hypothetical protein